MRRVLLVLALAACSARASNPSEPPLREAAAPPALTSEPVADDPTPRDPREAMLARVVTALLEREHLRRRPVDDALSRDAFALYVKDLDASKMFLLQQDARALDRNADRIDDQLRAGRLDLAHEGARLHAARVAVVEKMVAELLAAPMDLTDEEHVELDSEKLELAANDGELRDRWRRRLELEVLERVVAMEERLAGKEKKKDDDADDADDGSDTSAAPPVPVAEIPATPEERQAKARADLARAYSGRFARQRTPGKLGPATDLINAVAASYDPHTSYLPPQDKANFDIQMTGSLEGIGALLREKDHYIEIAEIVPGGASWRQGKLIPGDLILAVSQEGKEPIDVTDMRIDEVVKMIRGPKGTRVTLRIRKASGEEENITVTRDVVVIEEAYARGALVKPQGKDGATYGYIYLPSFYGGQGSARTSARDVRRLLEQMKARKVAGVVLDVRSNGGGLLSAAVDITGLFFDDGPVVQVQDSGGRREVLEDDVGGTVFDGPVVVLVDRFSASASEILAGALQDYHRAVVIGTGPTHGKGTVQSLADLERMTGGDVELGVFKLTIQQYFRVSGSSVQREGVIPDIVLPDPLGHIESGERELDHAIPWSQIQPARYQAWKRTWTPGELAAKSTARVAAHPIFAKISGRSRLLRTWRDDTKLPLARPAWEERRKKHREALEATSPELDKTAPRLSVEPLDKETAALAPGPGGKVDDRPQRWRDRVARDPWIEESLLVLRDMSR